MNNTIHKFILQNQHEQIVAMPVGARIISVAKQRELICVWAEVDKDEKRNKAVTFFIVGTGYEFPPAGAQFVGTVLLYGGDFVWHVYVLGE